VLVDIWNQQTVSLRSIWKQALTHGWQWHGVHFYEYFAECEKRVKWASANSLAWSIGHSVGRKLPLTNAQLDLTKRKMSSNGSVNVKHSEIIIKKDSRYVCQQLVVRAFSYLNCFKKLESICCPSYEMNAGSWVLITWCMQRMNIEQNNKLLSMGSTY